MPKFGAILFYTRVFRTRLGLGSLDMRGSFGVEVCGSIFFEDDESGGEFARDAENERAHRRLGRDARQTRQQSFGWLTHCCVTPPASHAVH